MSTRLNSVRAFMRKLSYIMREEGPVVLLDRLTRAGIVRARRRLRNTDENTSRWQAIKGRYAGERAFLIGNGPSLNRTPLHLLRDERTMAFNRFTLMYERLSWRPTMFSVIDDRVLLDMASEIGDIIREVDWAFFPDLHPYNIDFTRRLPKRDNLLWLHPDLLTFSTDLPWCGINKTVTNVGLQILAYLGFTHIYLIGVDMTYSNQSSASLARQRDVTAKRDDDPNHFDPRYFGAGRSYHNPRMAETLEKFQEARLFFEAQGVTILNAGVGGALEVFPRVNLRDVLCVDRERELQLLLAPTGHTPHGTTLRESFPNAKVLRAGDPWPLEAPAVICFSDDAVARIPQMIFEYVPFGPLIDEYVFLRREFAIAQE